MITTQAAAFAIETVKSAKFSMLENGIADAQMIYAVCKKLSSMLNIPFEMVVEIFENI
jgi:hypothetical protein